MSATTLSFDKLPDNVGVTPGYHKLTIVNAEPVFATTGSEMLQNTYQVDNTAMKINYDNCVIKKKDGSLNDMGLAKLKKILAATHVEPTGPFTLKVVCPMIKGKAFMAELVLDKQGKYMVLGNMNTIKSLEDYAKELEEIKTEQTETVTPTVVDPAPTDDIGQQEATLDDAKKEDFNSVEPINTDI